MTSPEPTTAGDRWAALLRAEEAAIRRRADVFPSVAFATDRREAVRAVADCLGVEPDLADQLLDLPIARFFESPAAPKRKRRSCVRGERLGSVGAPVLRSSRPSPLDPDRGNTPLVQPARRTVEVRWQDFDAYGHVHTVAHLAILEHARTRFFDELFPSSTTWDYVVVHLTIDFVAELLPARERYVYCEISPIGVGSKAITTVEEIFSHDGRKASSTRCVTLPWDRISHGTRNLSADERHLLQDHIART